MREMENMTEIRNPSSVAKGWTCSTMTRMFETITSSCGRVLTHRCYGALSYYTNVRGKRIICSKVRQVMIRIAADTSEQENHPFQHALSQSTISRKIV